MNIAEYLLDNKVDDSHIVIITSKKNFTYVDLRCGASMIARLLTRAGLEKGDRILLLDQSSFFWSCVYLGTILAGGVSVPLPDNIKQEKLAEIIAVTSARAVFLGNSTATSYAALVPSDIPVYRETQDEGNIEKGTVGLENLLQSETGSSTPSTVKQSDLAALMFTSGSTGEPRGVMVTHGNIRANTNSIIESLSLNSSDRVMAVLPFYYCFGTSLLHTHLAIGGSIVIENSFLFPEQILNRMEETGCTGLAGVPSTFQIFLRKSTIRNRKFEKLRYVQQAGGQLSVKFIGELREALPKKQIYIMYGQTEATARLSCLSPDKLEDKVGSIGKDIPGVKLQVLNNDSQEVKPGEIGEIVASGENITAGYWNAPEESAKYFRDGKLYTGDLAKVDDEGYIYIVDREKDFIKCAGHRVSSKEIEEAVLQSGGVVEALAIGVADDRLGEAVSIFVSHVRGEEARDELEKHCKMNIKWPFTPRQIVILKNLPKTSSGKPDKLKLKTMM